MSGFGDEQRRYQLAFRIPGIMPWSASSRSMIRLMPNFRYTPRARPVIWQRFRLRVENLGGLFISAKTRLLAMVKKGTQGPYPFSSFAKGTPSSVSTNRLIAGFECSKTRLTFIPCVMVTVAMLISGHTACSVSPRA